MQLRVTRAAVAAQSGFTQTDIVRAIFADSEPGWHWTVEEALKANEAALGPNLVVNGGFSDGMAGWSEREGMSVVDGVLQASVDAFRFTSRPCPLVAGELYRISFDLLTCVPPTTMRVGFSGGTTTSPPSNYGNPSLGRVVYWLTASAGNTDVFVGSGSAGFTGSVDNISVQRIDRTKCQAFQDSIGLVPVYAPEQPLGLILDTSRGLVRGPELIADTELTTNNASAEWITGGTGGANTVTFSGGQVAYVTDGTNISINKPSIMTSGKWYEAVIDVTAQAGAAVPGIYTGAQDINLGPGAGVRVVKFLAAGTTFTLKRIGSSAGSFTINSVSVRELPGNHFYQTDPTKRPTVTRRVNKIFATESYDNAAWNKVRASVLPVAAPDGKLTAFRLQEDTSSGDHSCRGQTITAIVGNVYRQSVSLKAGGRTSVQFYEVGGAGVFTVNLLTGVVTVVTAGGLTNISAESEMDGWWRLAYDCPAYATVQAFLYFGMLGPTISYVGDGDSGVYMWHPDVRLTADATDLPTYQRVTTTADYGEVGFPAGARFNGVNTELNATSVNFSSASESTLVASLLKEDDSKVATLLEFGGGGHNAFSVMAPVAASLNNFNYRSGGGTGIAQVNYNPGSGSSAKVVLTGLGSTTAPLSAIRVNGALRGTNLDVQGGGSYQTREVKLGDRLTGGRAFTGVVYGTTCVGKLQSDARLHALEERHRINGKVY